MGDYRKLKAWQAADDLIVDLYKVTKGFPNDERFGLTSQLRRAAVSIGSNIAEGAGRNGDAEFRRFLIIALGSANEVSYQVHLAGRLNYLEPPVVSALNAKIESVKRMLAALSKSLGSK